MKKILLTAFTALAFQSAPAVQDQLLLRSELSHPLLFAGETQSSYLKVGLTGFPMEPEAERAPINVTIVLDRSGSMSGQKIAHARQAAKMAVSRLSARDILSIVTYDDTVDVLVPATKLTHKKAIYAAIDEITSGGSTALFAGISKGAEELRKFKQAEAVNRIILLSDGQANVGPQTPQELGDLGSSLAREGIAVTTIGLGGGYNEDLMNQLALRSDGTHSFVETPQELAAVFDQELGDLQSVVAQAIEIEIEIADGIRPVRVLGREATIEGQKIKIALNQLYAEQEKFLLVEYEIPASQANRDQAIADARVTYRNMKTDQRETLETRSVARLTDDPAAAEEAANKEVMIAVVDFLANERNFAAMRLRDQGKIEEAKAVLRENALILDEAATTYAAPRLRVEAGFNRDDAENLIGAEWNEKRKAMTQRQNEKVTQNSGYRSKN
ncbi:MAG: VWA domain-containing protein [Verrucomicrobiota bacterium]